MSSLFNRHLAMWQNTSLIYSFFKNVQFRVRWHLCNWTLLRPDISAIWVTLLQGFQNGCAIFVAWKLTKLCIKLESFSILFPEKAPLTRRGPKKEPTVWQTGVSLQTPLSCPLLGGSHLCRAWHTHPLKSFKLSIFINNLVNFQATKTGTPHLESPKCGKSGCTNVRVA